jgi:choline transport protein
VLQGRRKLPRARAFVLPEAFAWFANILGVSYVIVTTILFLFPPELPVTPNNMNYCIVAFGIWLFIAVAQWIFVGSKNYTGPKVDIDERRLSAAILEEKEDEARKRSYASRGHGRSKSPSYEDAT